MKRILPITLTFLIAILQGCATTIHTPIPKESVRAAAAAHRPLMLESDFSYWTSSVAKSGGTVTLIAGKYIPVLENDSGVFYKGPAGCLVYRGKSVFGDDEHFSQDGGIWLPKEPSQHPRSFAFAGSLPAGTESTSTDSGLQTGLRSIPSGASPGAAGVGVALGLAIVALLAENEHDPQRIHFAFDPIGDGSNVRMRFRAPE